MSLNEAGPFALRNSIMGDRGSGGGGGGYSHTLPIRLCAAQRGRDFEAPDFNRTGYPFQMCFLERGIKNCGSRLYLL